MKYKKIKRVFLLLICILIVLSVYTACENSNTEIWDTDNTSSMQHLYDVHGFTVSYDNVIKQINNIMDLLDNDGNTNTRSSSTFVKRSIKDIQIITTGKNSNIRTKTSSSEEVTDTLVYLVNFDNDRGYAVLSADTRTDAILVLAEQGSLDLHDIPDNSNLIPLLENAEGLYNLMIEHPQFNHLQPIEDLDDEFYYNRYGAWEIVNQVSPMVPVDWGQR